MSMIGPEKSQLRVLVAEDNPVNQMFAARLIERQGHSAHVVANGQLAIDAMLNEDFDVVLMDISMPVKNGYEAVQQLREWEQITGSHIRVIAVTANVSELDRVRCIAAGMDGFVSKPIKALELAEEIDRVFREGICKSQINERECQYETKADSKSVCDLPAALKRLNDDECFFQQLAQLFLDTVPEQLKSLRTSVENSNGQLTSDLAHSVKGSVRHFFAASAYDAAQRLEFVGQSGNCSAMKETIAELVDEIEYLRMAMLGSFPDLHCSGSSVNRKEIRHASRLFPCRRNSAAAFAS